MRLSGVGGGEVDEALRALFRLTLKFLITKTYCCGIAEILLKVTLNTAKTPEVNRK